jgi:hypothetical protein
VTLVSAPLAAWYYSVPVGTIHRWASEDGWAKYGGLKYRRYALVQVQASFMRRRVPAEVLDRLTCGEATFINLPQSRPVVSTLPVECSNSEVA